MTTNPSQHVGPLELISFFCELAMLALLAIAGYGLGGIALALVFPIVAIAIWSVWMAPTSKRRLRNPSRLTVQGALFVCTAGLYGGVGSLWVGITFAVIAFGVFAELARRE